MSRLLKLVLLSASLSVVSVTPSFSADEGTVLRPTVTAGPFDLHRTYRSMEGPYIQQRFRISDLLQSKSVSLPESMVTFVEDTKSGAPMQATSQADAMISSLVNKPIGLVDTSGQKRELYWFKGVSLRVLDENDKPLPTAEFICHFNIDVDPAFRKSIFPDSEHSMQTRVIVLTQGQTSFHFPEGYAVPLSSDEVWSLTFQAAHRAGKDHRRIKHLCTLDFVKDSDLKKPMKALVWYSPYISVVLTDEDAAKQNEHHGPSCLVHSSGQGAENAFTNSTYKDSSGKLVSGHWTLPTGLTTYSSPVDEQPEAGFGTKERDIHAVWTHVHPLCKKTSLIFCNGKTTSKIFTIDVQTKTKGGLELRHIDAISSAAGIKMPSGGKYQLQAIYDNTTGKPQDSMVSHGVFFEDQSFKKPDWRNEVANSSTTVAAPSTAAPAQADMFCGIKSHCIDSGSATNSVEERKLFDKDKDGPLLSERKAFELQTTAGNLNLVLVPEWAPNHATQLYRLLTNGVYNGTPIVRYEPNFVLQVALAQQKVDGLPGLSEKQQELLRRIPLEVTPQEQGKLAHKRHYLTMARHNALDSAETSFSILLADSPHLDKQYTVFGYLDSNDESLKTIDSIVSNWNLVQPTILGARELDKSIAGRSQSSKY